jgi:hypothetical protein
MLPWKRGQLIKDENRKEGQTSYVSGSEKKLIVCTVKNIRTVSGCSSVAHYIPNAVLLGNLR